MSSAERLFLDLGLGDDHGLKVLPLGDLSLELCDDGGDVKLVLWHRALVLVLYSILGSYNHGGVLAMLVRARAVYNVPPQAWSTPP